MARKDKPKGSKLVGMFTDPLNWALLILASAFGYYVMMVPYWQNFYLKEDPQVMTLQEYMDNPSHPRARMIRTLGVPPSSVVTMALIESVISNRIIWILMSCILVLGAPVLLMRKTWPALYSTLVSYGLAARIPVAVVMFFATMGDWGTHYDGPPPGFPETGPFVEWLISGLIPQLTFWIAFTIIVGMLFGGVAAALKKTSS